MGNSQKKGKTGKVIIFRGQWITNLPYVQTNGLSKHVSLHFTLIHLHEFAIRLRDIFLNFEKFQSISKPNWERFVARLDFLGILLNSTKAATKSNAGTTSAACAAQESPQKQWLKFKKILCGKFFKFYQVDRHISCWKAGETRSRVADLDGELCVFYIGVVIKIHPSYHDFPILCYFL